MAPSLEDGEKTGVPAALRPVRWYLPFAALAAVSLGLVALSWTVGSLGHPIFAADGEIGAWVNVDTEGNLPTWWSATLLAAGGVLHLGGGWVARTTGTRGTSAWRAVAALLLLMSLDEAASLHESLDQLRTVITLPFQVEYFWVVIGVPLALLVLAVVGVCGRRMPRASLVLLVLGFGLLFTGAVGFEIVGSGQVTQGLAAEVVASYHLEEAFEMVGASLIAVAPIAGLRVAPGRPLVLALGPVFARRTPDAGPQG